ASRENRAALASSSLRCITFTATVFPSLRSTARNTRLIPPSPASETISNRSAMRSATADPMLLRLYVFQELHETNLLHRGIRSDRMRTNADGRLRSDDRTVDDTQARDMGRRRRTADEVAPPRAMDAQRHALGPRRSAGNHLNALVLTPRYTTYKM